MTPIEIKAMKMEIVQSIIEKVNTEEMLKEVTEFIKHLTNDTTPDIVHENSTKYNYTNTDIATISKQMTFEEAIAECNGIDVNEFCNELRAKVSKHYDKKNEQSNNQ